MTGYKIFALPDLQAEEKFHVYNKSYLQNTLFL